MNHLKKSIYLLTFVGMTGLWSCSSDEDVRNIENEGTPLPISITVSHDSPVTRTQLSEDVEFGLHDKWLENDELVIYSSTGAQVGKLKIESGFNEPTAVFSGTFTGSESGEYYLWYLGQPIDGKSPICTVKNGKLNIDLSNQDYKSAEELSHADVMSTSVKIKRQGDKAYSDKDVTMVPKLAMCRFNLQGIDNQGGTLRLQNSSSIDDITTYKPQSGIVYNPNGTQYGYITNTTGIEVKVTTGNDVYMAVVPTTIGYNFEFTGNNNKKYSCQTDKDHVMVAGKYYCKRPEAGSSSQELGGIEMDFNPIVEIDDKINGKRWAPSNNRSWIDASMGDNDIYCFSYIPEVPLTLQNIQTTYTNVDLTDANVNANIYLYQWGRYFGYIAGVNPYNGYYQYLPNYLNLPSYMNNQDIDRYKVKFKQQGIETALSYIEELYMPSNKNDWCSNYPFETWPDRYEFDDGQELLTAPDGFKIPDINDLIAIAPEDFTDYGTKSYTISDKTISINNDGTLGIAKPFYVLNLTDGSTLVWSVVKTNQKNYVDVRKLPSKYTEEQLNALTMKTDIFVMLPLDGSLNQDGSSLDYSKMGCYWANDCGSYGTQGGANALKMYLDDKDNPTTVSFQISVFPRWNCFSLRCLYTEE